MSGTAKMSVEELAMLFQRKSHLGSINIGAVKNLERSSFSDNVVHVFFFVHEKGENFLDEKCGDNACIVVLKNGDLYLELSEHLDMFWNHWSSQMRAAHDASDVIENAVEEIARFFEKKDPRDKARFVFMNGHKNERLHRVQRSMEKCSMLEQVFGYKLTASEG